MDTLYPAQYDRCFQGTFRMNSLFRYHSPIPVLTISNMPNIKCKLFYSLLSKLTSAIHIHHIFAQLFIRSSLPTLLLINSMSEVCLFLIPNRLKEFCLGKQTAGDRRNNVCRTYPIALQRKHFLPNSSTLSFLAFARANMGKLIINAWPILAIQANVVPQRPHSFRSRLAKLSPMRNEVHLRYSSLSL